MIQPDQIATPQLIQEHPELHHYTSIEGLRGIVESNTLWATHFEDLNDASEFIHLRRPLVEALSIRLRPTLIIWREGSFKRARDLERWGGVPRVATGLAADLVQALYTTAFGSGTGDALATPYVASFCSHSGDMEYERRNGLLSQWRGYGGRDGVCIVFETARLVEMLRREFTDAYWVHMVIGSAEYAVNEASIDRLFPGLVARCEDVVASMIKEGGPSSLPDDLFPQLVDGASRYKHRGFFEEREVRLVAIPAPASTLALMREQHPDFKAGPLKTVARRPRGNGQARYVILFEEAAMELPINRVIVGPSPRQVENEAVVRSALPGKISVVRSETPFE